MVNVHQITFRFKAFGVQEDESETREYQSDVLESNIHSGVSFNDAIGAVQNESQYRTEANPCRSTPMLHTITIKRHICKRSDSEMCELESNEEEAQAPDAIVVLTKLIVRELLALRGFFRETFLKVFEVASLCNGMKEEEVQVDFPVFIHE